MGKREVGFGWRLSPGHDRKERKGLTSPPGSGGFKNELTGWAAPQSGMNLTQEPEAPPTAVCTCAEWSSLQKE